MTVKNTIALQDKMSSVLQRINTNLNKTKVTLGEVDKTGAGAFSKVKSEASKAVGPVETLNKEVSKIPAAANRGATAFDGMKMSLVNVASLIYTIRSALQALSSITNIVDNYTLTSARLDLVNDGLQTTAQLQEDIFDSALRARSEYESTATAVSKIGLLAGDAFTNTKEIVSFAELMNKSFKVGGSSIQEQNAAMYQLTQAMAAGKLQGDEFRSVMENAPMLAQAIATYTGKTMGELKQMSAEGTISADIIKNALFTAAEDINTKFQSLPMTFSDSMLAFKNGALRAFQPVMQRLNKLANSKAFKKLSANAIDAMTKAADATLKFLDAMETAVTWVQANWPMVKSTIVSALGGIAAAYLTAKTAAALYAIAQGTVNVELLLFYGRLAIIAIAIAGAIWLWQNFGTAGKILAIILGFLAAAMIIATVAQWAFNAAQYACPYVWIIGLALLYVAVMVAVVAAIIYAMNTSLKFKYAFIDVGAGIVKSIEYMKLGFSTIGNAIAMAFSTAKVTALSQVQSLANGVLSIINRLIAALNSIPGVSVAPMEQISMQANINAEKAKQNAIKANQSSAVANTANRLAALPAAVEEMKAKAAWDSKTNAKPGSLADTLAKWNSGAGGGGGGGIPTAADYADLASAAGNPKMNGGSLDSIKDSISITDEDIKLLKDVAATEFVNKYTSLKPEMSVQFGDVRETADVGKIMSVIEDMVEEAYASSLVNA